MRAGWHTWALMPALLLSVVLATGPVRLAATAMTLVDVPEARGRFFDEHLTQRLSLLGLQVTTSSDIARALGLERQRQLLGCSEGSCMTELAGALGADAVVASTLAHVGASYTLNVRVTGARQAETVSVFSGRGDTEEQVLALITEAAERVAADLGIRRGPPPEVRRVWRPWAWIPGVLTVLTGVGGGVAYWLSTQEAARFAVPGAFRDVAELNLSAERGAIEQSLGLAGFIAGGVCLVVTVLLVWAGGPEVRPVALGPGVGGLAVHW